ncbi:MAG: alpha/beta fold hydrolase [Actinomycetota bacterium]
MTVITAANERPLFFSSGDEMSFGIITEPEAPRGIAVISLAGAVHVPSANRNRIWVRLNRTLAADGFHALRFEYAGTGESSGPGTPFERDKPRTNDLLGAVAFLREQGLDRFVLVGTCFGALTALLTAPQIEGVEKIVLLSPLILDSKSYAQLATETSVTSYVRKALRPRTITGAFRSASRASYKKIARAKIEALRDGGETTPDGLAPLPVSPRVMAAIRSLVDRGTPTTIAFGSEDAHYEDWRRATRGRLGRLIESADNIDVVVLPGYLHSFPQLSVQDEVVDLVSTRVTYAFGGAPSLSTSS